MHPSDASPAGFEPSTVAALPSSLSESVGDRAGVVKAIAQAASRDIEP
jgi:hypothetical protein